MKTIQINDSTLTSYDDDLLKEIGSKMPKALKTVGLDLKAESMQLAPLDEGDLRGSAHVSDLKADENGIYVEVRYSTPYALRMHEDLTYTPQHSGTGPKYLEKPAFKNAQRYTDYLMKALKSDG